MDLDDIKEAIDNIKDNVTELESEHKKQIKEKEEEIAEQEEYIKSLEAEMRLPFENLREELILKDFAEMFASKDYNKLETMLEIFSDKN